MSDTMSDNARRKGLYLLRGARYAACVLFLILLSYGLACAEDSLNALKDETLSFFKPMRGKIVSLQDKVITSDLGSKAGVKKGMRFTIFREGTPFLHPVTKEPMGRVEAPVGKAEVKDVGDDRSTMEIITGKAAEGDILRISEIKARLLFYQDKNVDWNLADAYYQLLKESGRFDMMDTALDSADDAQIIAEGKRLGAEAVLILTSQESERETVLKQRILWISDSVKLAESAATVDGAVLKELRAARNMMAPLSSSSDALVFFDLPFRASLMTAGDFKGDGDRKLVIGYGRQLHIYSIGASLESVNDLKCPGADDVVWLDAMDVNGDGRDEIVVTAMRGRDVDTTSDSMIPEVKDAGNIVSYVYSLQGAEPTLLWKTNLFLRVLPGLGLIGQNYDTAGGFGGPIFRIRYNSGKFTKGDSLKLPRGPNIYDFAYLDGANAERYVLAYDGSGYLNLYNAEGLKVWQSRENYLGFRDSFKIAASTSIIDKGEWSVKDRLFVRNRESFVVKRKPLAKMVRGLGYGSSQIQTMWWSGLSMEVNTFVEGIAGSVMDYVLLPDRLVVLSRPLFGLKPKNILKGESPFGSMLYVYSLKGR
ncbi:MAG: VCBS repeat-containing protein [Nitrospirae bacterium]|nr:VCBS repeat-containing protein [Nitrospirota bacterium]